MYLELKNGGHEYVTQRYSVEWMCGIWKDGKQQTPKLVAYVTLLG